MSNHPAPDSNKKLTDHRILIFDVYGTLCDWETGLYNALQPLLKAYPSATSTWTRRDALTTFSSIEGVLQAQLPGMPYRELLELVYVALEAKLKAQGGTSSATPPGPVSSSNEKQDEGPSFAPAPRDSKESPAITFARSIQHWPIFPDSSAALARLAKHFKLVVLSNVDNESLGSTHKLLSVGSAPEAEASSPSLYSYPTPNPNKFWHPQETSDSKSPFTAILTAQDVGCYKPSPKGFCAALDYFQSQPELFGITDGAGGESSQDKVKEKVLCVAQSLRHDIEPANELGFHSVWIDRQSAVTCNEAGEGKPGWGKWTWRFETLGAMAEAVEKEVGQCP